MINGQGDGGGAKRESLYTVSDKTSGLKCCQKEENLLKFIPLGYFASSSPWDEPDFQMEFEYPR